VEKSSRMIESPESMLKSLEKDLNIKDLPSDKDICRCLLEAIKKSSSITPPILRRLVDIVSKKKGLQSALNILMRLEVALGFRRPTVGIYDNALHFIGGAQKYGCAIANAIQDDFAVTLITNAEISLSTLQDWYDMDLSRCKIKTIKIPFFEERRRKTKVFDAGIVDLKKENPFHVISKESGNYDVFVNNCMLEMVYPLANISELICHFPEREISRFFHVDKYSHIICNSIYTAKWIEKKWRLKPHKLIYPPVDMGESSEPGAKKNIILSVSRFELGGNKQQIEMIKAFIRLCQKHPELMGKWKLILAGGSTEENPYLDRVRNLVSLLPHGKVELKINVSDNKLKEIYRKAMIFWHFSGLNQTDPARIEHFGMTTVEAMRSGCVPVVFKGGGQQEIIEEGVSGFFFHDLAGLFTKTIKLIKDPELVCRLSQQAHQRAKFFTRNIFTAKVKEHFTELLDEYTFKTEI